MTIYYVDNAAVGTGDGLTPANAFTSAEAAITALSTSGHVTWIRRTTDDAALTSEKSNGNHWIGWPEPGDPGYDARPAEGTGAGWDADPSGRPIVSLACPYEWVLAPVSQQAAPHAA